MQNALSQIDLETEISAELVLFCVPITQRIFAGTPDANAFVSVLATYQLLSRICLINLGGWDLLDCISPYVESTTGKKRSNTQVGDLPVYESRGSWQNCLCRVSQHRSVFLPWLCKNLVYWCSGHTERPICFSDLWRNGKALLADLNYVFLLLGYYWFRWKGGYRSALFPGCLFKICQGVPKKRVLLFSGCEGKSI